ncbi:Fasciclin-like arabinogalactan protein 14 [Linum grandiflorum]
MAASSSSSSIHHLIQLIFLFLFTFTSSSSAFNVTSLLGPLTQFSTFSNYLAQVGLVPIIADLNNVTILAVPNSKMASISGKSRDQIRRIMAMHIIPEYYDLQTLNKKTLQHGTASLRTVYLLTGLAKGKDGLLLVSQRKRSNSHRRLTFSSAALPPRANHINLIQSVLVPSHNVSVFHVSDLIATAPLPPSDVAAGVQLGGARISLSNKMVMKLEQEKIKTTEDGIFPKTSLDFLLVPDEDAPPAKAPAKSGGGSSSSSPKKSPSKAPTSPSSNSTSKGKSPSSAPSSDSSAPAPTKKKSGAPSPAQTKPASPPTPSKEPKAKASEPSPSESSENNTPPPSKSGTTSSPPPSESPASGTSSPPAGNAPSKSSPPAPAVETPAAESPAGEAPSAEAPTGGAAPMTVNKVGVMVTVMVLWALAA